MSAQKNRRAPLVPGPQSAPWLDQCRERPRLFDAKPVAEMLQRFGHGAAGTNLQIGHVQVCGERRIGIAQLPANAFKRRLHTQPGVGANYEKIHEIREAGLMLGFARPDALADIEAWPDVAGDATEPGPEPKRRTALF